MLLSIRRFCAVAVPRPAVCIGLLFVTSCGADGRASSPPDEPGGVASDRAESNGVASEPPASSAVAARTIVPRRQDDGAPLETALHAAYIHTRQLEAGAAYRVVRSAGDVTADNEAQSLAVRFEAARVVLSRAAQGRARPDPNSRWSSGLSFAGIGRAGRRADPSVGEMTTSDGRVAYQRQGLEEWYLNGPLGLEQGFTIDAAPAGKGSVEIAVAVSGDLTPGLVSDGAAVELRSSAGEPILGVEGLFVQDADGRELRSWFEIDAAGLVLHYDDSGARYPVEVDPLVTHLDNKVNASDPAQLAFFGLSVAASNGTAAIGSPGAGASAPANNDGPGAVYVFVRGSGGTWSQQAKLTVSGLNVRAGLGSSVALSGNTIIAGTPAATSGTVSKGAAFVFTRSGTTWTQQAKLVASNGASGDRFGTSVAISGDRAIVGAPYHDVAGTPAQTDAGAAYFFTRSGTTWTQRASIPQVATAGGHFGMSVALSRLTAIIGEPEVSHNGVLNAGFAHAYEALPDDSSWSFQQTLAPPSPVTSGAFGKYVALNAITASDSGFAIVGETNASTSRGATSGTAHVFKRSGTTWSRQATLTPATGAANSHYGIVSLSPAGNRAVVGAVGDVVTTFPVAVFAASGTSWSEQPVVAIPADNAAHFGISVSLDTNALVIGAQSGSAGSLNGTGAAYLYSIGQKNGDACTSASACLSGFCVDGVCCNSACGGGSTTDCQACSTAKGGTQTGACTALSSAVAPQTTCRAAAGACDVADKCVLTSLNCPADVKKPSGTACRAAAGLCDIAETCNGTSAACPSDVVMPFGTLCGSSLLCQALCTGADPDCGCP
jgi:hypothetical protein